MNDPAGVLIDAVGSTLVITLNRAERRNAVDLAMASAIADAVDLLDSDPQLRVGVITGAGGTFCTGMDLHAFAQGVRPSLPGRGFAGLTEHLPVKPLIAAVEGYAYAGGCEIALACDLVVASRRALFALPEVKRGLVAAAGALLRLPLRLPGQIATELALTGQPLGAERAYHFGLVNRLVDDGQALEIALALADQIAGNAPLAVRATKQILRAAQDWTVADQFERQREISEPVFASHDALEGARAFAERREPQWQGA